MSKECKECGKQFKQKRKEKDYEFILREFCRHKCEKAHQMQPRNCMNCRKSFKTTENYRLCASCRTSPASSSGGSYAIAL